MNKVLVLFSVFICNLCYLCFEILVDKNLGLILTTFHPELVEVKLLGLSVFKEIFWILERFHVIGYRFNTNAIAIQCLYKFFLPIKVVSDFADSVMKFVISIFHTDFKIIHKWVVTFMGWYEQLNYSRTLIINLCYIIRNKPC
jgi:hypothetical protein